MNNWFKPGAAKFLFIKLPLLVVVAGATHQIVQHLFNW